MTRLHARGSRFVALAIGLLIVSAGPGMAAAESLTADGGCPETIVTAPIAADTWVDESSPLANKGTDSVLSVESGTANVDTLLPGDRARTLVAFVMPPAVPLGCVVGEARLRLFAPEESIGTRLEVRRVAAAWSEATVSWSDQPDAVGPAVAAWSREGYMHWNVAALVSEMLASGGGHGFQVRHDAEGTEVGGSGQEYYGREKGETPPELVIHFTDPPSDKDPGPPAPPDPASVTCGQVLTRSTLVTNDLAECLTDGLVIGAPRIILDLGGHTIDGIGLGDGVRNDGYDTVTIRNGTIQEFDHGVHLLPGADDAAVEDLHLVRNEVGAVELFDVAAASIGGNTLDGNGGGINLVSGTHGATVADNVVTANGGAGLLLRDATDNRLERNQVDGGGDLGIGLHHASRNILVANLVALNSDGGIELRDGSHDNHLESNVVNASGDTGILVSESNGNRLISNTTWLMSDSGITLEAANDGLLRGNDVRFNTGGLQLDGSSGNLLEANDASATSGIGIEVGGGSFGNALIDNLASGNAAQGIYVADDVILEPGNRLAGNIADGNLSDGIVVAKGGHSLTRNVTNDNGGWGILAALGTIDGGRNVAKGNGKPEQCLAVICLTDPPPPDPAPDTSPPDTIITAGPDVLTASTAATLEFEGSDDTTPPDAVTFACSFDGAPFSACTSPARFDALGEGEHTFAVRALDAGGNVDSTPAVHIWTIDVELPPPDVVAPDTSITEAPATLTNVNAARFAFASNEVEPTFQCSLDDEPFASCASPATYSSIADGEHQFRVRAVDAAGNADAEPAEHAWTVDTKPPETTIGVGPVSPTNATSATFSFTSGEAGSTFECSLDSAAYSGCESPVSFSDLGDGSHQFDVRAVDPAGNTDPIPASMSWAVDTVAPDTAITAAPASPTNATSATFGFVSGEVGSTFECSLDAAPFTSCSSPVTVLGLSQGGHAFQVRAVDRAANADPTPAPHLWTIEADAPDCGPTLTLTATADAWIDQRSPARNRGRDSNLRVQSEGPSANLRALVRFTMPTFAPAGCVVKAATLRLFAVSAATGRTLEAVRITGAWTEQGVTWQNQPATTGPAATTASGRGYREWNVQGQVQATLDVGGQGFLIRDATENEDAAQSFLSRERGGNRPQLVITFAPG